MDTVPRALLYVCLFLLIAAPAYAQTCIEYDQYFHWAGNLNTGGIAKEVVLAGDIVYLVDNGALRVIDISDITNPRQVNFIYNTYCPGFPDDIAVSGNYVYVAAGDRGLQVFDVSVPSDPQIVGSVGMPNNAKTVELIGDLAYVAVHDYVDYNPAGLYIVDVSDPLDPVILGTALPGDVALDVSVVGDMAYTVDGWSFQAIDVSVPSAPVVVGEYATSSAATGLCAAGHYVYVADGHGGLKIYDVVTLDSPPVISETSLPVGEGEIALSGDHAIVTTAGAGLRILDVSDPAIPVWSWSTSPIPRHRCGWAAC